MEALLVALAFRRCQAANSSVQGGMAGPNWAFGLFSGGQQPRLSLENLGWSSTRAAAKVVV